MVFMFGRHSERVDARDAMRVEVGYPNHFSSVQLATNRPILEFALFVR